MRYIIARRPRIVLAADDRDVDVRSSMGTLSRHCAEARTVPYILAALDFALEAKDPAVSIENVVSSSLSPADATYIEDVLLPLIPKVQTWSHEHGTNLDHFICRIVVLFRKEVLGPQPPADATLAGQLSRLEGWKCPMPPCCATRDFLTTSKEKSSVLERIGSRMIKHLDEEIERYAADIVTTTVVRTAKLSLRVCFVRLCMMDMSLILLGLAHQVGCAT